MPPPALPPVQLAMRLDCERLGIGVRRGIANGELEQGSQVHVASATRPGKRREGGEEVVHAARVRRHLGGELEQDHQVAIASS